MKSLLKHLHILILGEIMKYMLKKINQTLSILLFVLLLMIVYYHWGY